MNHPVEKAIDQLLDKPAAGCFVQAVDGALPKNEKPHLILVRSLKGKHKGQHKVKISKMNPALTGFYIKYSKDGQHPVEEVVAWARLFAFIAG